MRWIFGLEIHSLTEFIPCSTLLGWGNITAMQLQISDKSELKVNIKTEDPIERQICVAYWDWEPVYGFRQNIAAIARNFGVSSSQVNSIVERGCVAHRADCVCRRCGVPSALFTRRYHFESIVGDIYSDPDQFEYCSTCHPIVKLEEKESWAKSKVEMMKWAFDDLVHQSLEPVEFDFLVQLASNSSIISAANQVNISRKYAIKLLARLDAIHLIDWHNKSKLTWEDWEARVSMLDELKSMLREEKSRRRVKSIFSTDSLDLFRKLKSRYPFVFPELPLCTFIDRSDVESLLQGDDLNLFTTCRVDFLVCDRDGSPISAVEHDMVHRGDSHLNEFKRKILAAVGLPVTTLKSAHIKDEEALP